MTTVLTCPIICVAGWDGFVDITPRIKSRFSDCFVSSLICLLASSCGVVSVVCGQINNFTALVPVRAGAAVMR